MDGQIEENCCTPNRLIVWKSNDLVRTVKYELLPREYKILAVAISRIQRHQTAFEPVVLTVREFSELLDLKRDAVYSDIKAMAETLASRVIRLFDPQTQTHTWSNWCDVTYTEGSGCVCILFREPLKPHLLQLADFYVRYGLDNVLRLKSPYHARLYEFLKSWESHGHPRIVPLNELRTIIGAESKGYERFFVLNGSVLKPAKEAINSETDIKFRYEPIWVGRGVTGVKFTITPPSAQAELPLGDQAVNGTIAPKRRRGRPPKSSSLQLADTIKASTPDQKFSGDTTDICVIGTTIVSYWNEHMVHSPITVTGPDRIEEIGNAVISNEYLCANWRDLIQTVKESKIWNGRGLKERDGQIFHASFSWFLENIDKVADAMTARLSKKSKATIKVIAPSSPSDVASLPLPEDKYEELAAVGKKELRQFLALRHSDPEARRRYADG